MHRPDYGTEIGETLSALSDLVRAGKIRALRTELPFISALPVADLRAQADELAELLGLGGLRGRCGGVVRAG
jgi:aryl-alcohol dehydrogenase-like predicted oxidoreductase